MTDTNPIDKLLSATGFCTKTELYTWIGVSRQAMDKWEKSGCIPLSRSLEIKQRLLNEQGVEVRLCDLNKQFGQAA
jgi:hypothetical protein